MNSLTTCRALAGGTCWRLLLLAFPAEHFY
jgi:hypothetical protein